MHDLLKGELGFYSFVLIGLGCPQPEARLGRTDLLIFLLHQPTYSSGFVYTLGFMGAWVSQELNLEHLSADSSFLPTLQE